MKKQNVLICLVLLLALLCGLPANADTADSVAAGFVQDGEIFAYFNLQTDDVKELNVRVQTGSVMQAGNDTLSAVTTFAESDFPVHYYILLDRSTSMPARRSYVDEFVEGLLDNTTADVRTTIATFGDAFEVELSAAVDKNAVMKKLNELDYDELQTDLYRGIDEALDDIAKLQRVRGELVQIILITDGVPVDVSETPTPEEVQLRIDRSPELVFHTLMLDNDEPMEISGDLQLCGYTSVTMGDYIDASEEVEAVIAYTDSLYTAAWKPASAPAEGRSDLQFIFTRGQTIETVLPLGSVPVLGHAGAPDLTVSSEPDSSAESSSAPESSEPESSEETSSAPESSEPETSTETPSLPETSEEDEPQSEQSEESEAESSEPASSEETEENTTGLGGFFASLGMGTWILIGVIGGVVLLLIILLVVILLALSHRKKQRQAAQKRAAPPVGAVMLRLEVLDGRCLRVRKPLFVADELFIGTDMNGGIVWDEPAMAEKNTRLFMQDGVLYIEDLDSPEGTALGGMRIFAPNRLRSGEIISIGMVQFKLYF